MSQRLHRNKTFLKKLTKCYGKKREKIINDASNEQIQSLTEVAHNIVKGNFPIPQKTLKKLSKHKIHIRKLSKLKPSSKSKRKLLIQKGGFLPLMITPVLSALGAVAGRAISTQLGL